MHEAAHDEPDLTLGSGKPWIGVVLDARFWFVLFLLSIAVLWLWPAGEEDATSSGLGKRLVAIGDVAPKGGGHFKIGEPYEILALTTSELETRVHRHGHCVLLLEGY
ncbi:MAG: hypothetical protein AAF405_01580, partial [Pseudomonadota bacterium]